MNHLGCTQRKFECALNLRKASRSISGHGTSASLDSQLGWNCCQHLGSSAQLHFLIPQDLHTFQRGMHHAGGQSCIRAATHW